MTEEQERYEIVEARHDITVTGDLQGLKARYKTLVAATQELLRDGVDYGVIPGTNDKPVLLKPGAEKLTTLFGLRPRFLLVDKMEDWDQGRFYYRYRCELLDRSGQFLADAEGSCNSLESKYRWRQARLTCPSCGADTVMRSRYPPRNDPQGKPGWYCRSCKAQYAFGDERITKQETGRVENPEPFSLINTIQKMAQKRALVAAVLVATGASEFFTQDLEDMPVSGAVVEQETAPPEPESAEPETPDNDREPVVQTRDGRQEFWATYHSDAKPAGIAQKHAANIATKYGEREGDWGKALQHLADAIAEAQE